MAKKPTTKAIPKASIKITATETKKSWSPVTKYALFLGVLAFCVYANTLKNDYALDDWPIIRYNSIVNKGMSAIPQILSSPYWYGNLKNLAEVDEYRPLSLIMFAIESQLFPENAMPEHFINVLLYAGCVMLFFLFLYHLFKKQKPFIAFIASLLFAVHPIHTEIVANIKSRDELLCFFFGFLALNTFMKYTDTNKKRFLISGLFFYFLSLLSKETSFTFLAVFPLIFFFYRNENKKNSIYISLLPFIPALIFLLIRYLIFRSYNFYHKSGWPFYIDPLVDPPSFAVGIATKIWLLGYYLKLLIIPYPLICDYSYNSLPFRNFSNIGVWLSFVIYVFLAYVGITRLLFRSRISFSAPKCDPLAFGVLFFLITISIFSNLLFLIGSEISERFLFFPSVGFCVIVAFIIERIIFKTEVSDFATIQNKRVLYILIPLSLIYVGITINRNGDWKNNLTLYEADSKKSPNNTRLFCFAGLQELLENKITTDPELKSRLFTNAMTNLYKSVAIYPDYDVCQNQLAVVYLNLGELDSAELHGTKAVKNGILKDNLLNTLANVYMAQKKYEEANKLLLQANSIDSTNIGYIFNIGLCKIHEKQYDSAVYYSKKAIQIAPASAKAIENIAYTFNIIGQADSAKKYENLARNYDPGFNIGKIYIPNYGLFE